MIPDGLLGDVKLPARRLGVRCSAVDSSEESDDESVFKAVGGGVAAYVVWSDTANLKSVLSEPQYFLRSDTMSVASEGSKTPEGSRRPVPGLSSKEVMDHWYIDDTTWENWEKSWEKGHRGSRTEVGFFHPFPSLP